MKIKDLRTSDPYTKVATRAKLCLEVEQQKLWPSGWVNRVLVLDKATLYSYRPKGNSGSVNGWGIGGAEVGARRPRKDGRFLVIISRPQSYRIVFALNSLYEQGCFMKALSTSGATITGYYGVRLVNELEDTKKALRKSLGEKEMRQTLVNDCGRHEENEKLLAMPQLSSRMTEVNWTFEGHAGGKVIGGGGNGIDGKLTGFSATQRQSGSNGYFDPTIELESPFNMNFDGQIVPADVTSSNKENLGSCTVEPRRNLKQKSQNRVAPNDDGVFSSSNNLPFKNLNSGHETNPRNGETLPKTSPVTLKNNSEASSVPAVHPNSPNPAEGELLPLNQVLAETTSKNRFEREGSSTEEPKQTTPVLKPFPSGRKSDANPMRPRGNEGSSLEGKTAVKSSARKSETDDAAKNLRRPKKTDGAKNNLDATIRKFSLTQVEEEKESEIILAGDLGVASQVGGKAVGARVVLTSGKLLVSRFLPQEDGGEPGRRPASSVPVERINLEVASVVPVLGKTLITLVLKKKNKCIKILQFETREEQTLWMHKISDEVMNVTPLTKRNSLTLFPTPSKERRSSKMVVAHGLMQEKNAKEPSQSSSKPESRAAACEPPTKPVTDSSEEPNQSSPSNEPESKPKTLKRRLAIRRQSRETEKTMTIKEIDIDLPAKQALPDMLIENDALGNKEGENTLNYLFESSSSISKHEINGSYSLEKLDCTGVERPLKECTTVQELCPSRKAIPGCIELNDTETCKIELNKDIYDRIPSLPNGNLPTNKLSNESVTHSTKHIEPIESKYSPRIARINVKNIIRNFNEISEIKNRNIDPKISLTIKENNTLKEPQQPFVKVNQTFVSRETSEQMKAESDSMEGDKAYFQNTLILKARESRTEQTIDFADTNPSIGKNNGHLELKDNSDNEDNRKVVGVPIAVTWSVKAIRERYEILSTVNGTKTNSSAVLGQNSITIRKKMRDSIRRKRFLDGEFRRASLRKSFKRSLSHEPQVLPVKTPANHANAVQEPGARLHGSTLNVSTADGTYRNLSRSQSHLRSTSLRRMILTKEIHLGYLKHSSLSRVGSFSTKLRKVSGNSSLNDLPSQLQRDSIVSMQNDSILEILNNAFLAKRYLVAREIELAKIQDAVVKQEELIWRLHSQITALKSPELTKNQPRHTAKDFLLNRNEEEISKDLESLENLLAAARSDDVILEEKLQASKRRVEVAKQRMELNINKSFQSERKRD